MRALFLVVLIACSAALEAKTPSPTPVPSAPTPSRSPSPLVFAVTGAQARLVATTLGFIDAWNAGHVADALAVLTEDVVGSDCDARGSRVQLRGKEDFARWLAERAAEHDRLEVARILNENPDPSTGARVVGVVYASRTSDAGSLAPRGGTKVVFSEDGLRIIAFANC